MRKVYEGILVTDEVNSQKIRIPVEELTSGLEKSARFSVKHNLPFGVPSNIGHDLHRPLGWCRPTGILVSNDLARQVGSVFEAEDTDEKIDVERLIDRCRAAFTDEGVEPFETDLRTRLSDVDLQDAELIRCEAAAFVQPGLAAALYPLLLEEGGGAVDKDGLVDLKKLLTITTQVKPGIFHDRKRNLLLFAHPYFRRSLSRRNSLNAYFLRRFTECASEHPELRARLRLDPDMIGYPESALYILEFEHWRGPKFSNDIAAMPNGLTEYKAGDEAQYYEGISRTQFWWKAPETRDSTEGVSEYRTLEAEELIEDSSQGISNQHFGCRYIHAEFSAATNAITHFDGAIRAYESDPYLARIETSLDRAGKNTDYTKLFRFDGPLAIKHWQELSTDFYKGNPTLAEYFGGEPDSDASSQTEVAPEPDRLPPEVFQLMALISFHPQGDLGTLAIIADDFKLMDGSEMPYLELPTAELQRTLLSHINSDRATFLHTSDGKLNFPRVRFAALPTTQSAFSSLVQRLAASLGADIDAGLLKEVSFCFEWSDEEITTRLALAGDARCVRELMAILHLIIKCAQPARAWAGLLKAEIAKCVTRTGVNTDPQVEITDDGRLRLGHFGAVNLLVPVNGDESQI